MKDSSAVKIVLICSCLFFSSFALAARAADAIAAAQSIKDGETIVSAGGTFELGFFSPGSSKNRYLGIWYKNPSPRLVVWVANRETPIFDSSGILTLTHGGILILLNGTQKIIWATNSTKSAQNPIAQLLDSGDFVVREADGQNTGGFLWHSFEHPSDTLLSGMKLGINLVTGQEWCLSSWKTADDPSPGAFKLRVDPQRFRELVLTKNSVVVTRSGLWNGLGFAGTSGMKDSPIFKFKFVSDEKEMYYSYELRNSSFTASARSTVNQSGSVQRYFLDRENRNHDWILYHSTDIEDNCNKYNVCGPFGRCNANNLQMCSCLQGFVPKFPKAWNSMNWTGGCVRETPLECGSGDGFLKMTELKLPDAINYWYSGSMSLEECRWKCLMNCSCNAYADTDHRGGTGCLLWFSELMDLGDSSGNPHDIYIRMAASELAEDGDTMKVARKSSRNEPKRIILSFVVVVVALLLGLPVVLFLWSKMKQLRKRNGVVQSILESDHASQTKNLDLPVFDLKIIAHATDNFTVQNKLGEGGFGPVYKGVLQDGQEIAVKRLSKGSTQGLDEFKNEVRHIAKLQHRNLVKLLGCCIEGDEKMLVYEYMPNRSLDSFIFDQTKRLMLDWPSRFHITDGIARGLLYLHQDSRLRIIHRDLKASNVLLDVEMNPKISDFGMARSFSGNESAANTKRVVGTYGYMSPEYAVDGHYSTKSDVFSFGVLVLEVVSGKRNRGFRYPGHHLNLLGHAWKLYTENRALELIDTSFASQSNSSHVLRLIHLGLLCVQRHPEDRPSMAYVVQSLGSDCQLQSPKQPGFFNERNPFEAYSSSCNNAQCTFSATVTVLEPR